jgi:hypothetical protein
VLWFAMFRVAVFRHDSHRKLVLRCGLHRVGQLRIA